MQQNRTFAQLTLEIARVKPHKKRRMKWLKDHRPELFKRIVEFFGLNDFLDYFELNVSFLDEGYH